MKDIIVDTWEEITGQIICQILYTIGVLIYLGNLQGFNKQLTNRFTGEDIFEIMSYNNGEAWWYLLGALIFFLIGAGLVVFYVKSMNNGYWPSVIVLFLFIFLIFFLSCRIWGAIDNPILRAAMGVFAVAGGAGALYSKS